MSKFKIQYKVTVWQEIELDSTQLRSWGTKDEIIERLKKNTQTSPWDLFEGTQTNTLYETEEMMTIEENDGQETIEVYEDDKIIWTNAETQ